MRRTNPSVNWRIFLDTLCTNFFFCNTVYNLWKQSITLHTQFNCLKEKEKTTHHVQLQKHLFQVAQNSSLSIWPRPRLRFRPSKNLPCGYWRLCSVQKRPNCQTEVRQKSFLRKIVVLCSWTTVEN